MSIGRADGTLTWRALINDLADEVGRPQARWLCETASGLDGDDFSDELDRPATQRQVAHLDAMLARFRGGEPLQYVLGRWGFRRLDLMVDRRVLIPRPETELLVDVALERLRRLAPPYTCVDLGTGCGAIGLALADELPLDGVSVWLTDADADALAVARANLAGIGRAGVNVRIAEGSWFAALDAGLRGTVSLIAANAPYVAVDDPQVEPIVRDWEPHVALFGGADGLDHVRDIVAGAPEWLMPGGWLVLEIGYQQGAAVADLVAAHGFSDVEVITDLSGLDRLVVARLPRPKPPPPRGG
jgi:release factor glutamine methyltransferase